MSDRLRLALIRAVHVVSVAAFAVAAYFAVAPAAHAQAKKAAAFDAAPCLACHKPIKEFHDSGKHKGVACNACHGNLDQHVADRKARPSTNMDPAACGACHKLQYDSQFTMNWEKPARSEKSQQTGPSPNPAWDKLMTPHGFTSEHNLPRSHAAHGARPVRRRPRLRRPLRAEGGLAVPHAGRRQLQGVGHDLIDKYPDNSEHKAFKPGTAAAANPVCM